MLTLRTAAIELTLDPAHGADICSIVSLPSGSELLFATPWRERAQAAIAGGGPAWSTDSAAGFLETYRGGWQTLCPVAGPARAVHGAPVGFHGEAARVAWDVLEASDAAARLRLHLTSVPVRIDRELALTDATLLLRDTLTNLSDQALTFDYSQHPAFGGALLNGACTISTGARRFVADPGTRGELEAGASWLWPVATTVAGGRLDLSHVPPPGVGRMVFGWLEDFAEPAYELANPAKGLAVQVSWDGAVQPYAWLWAELNGSPDYPWYRQARTVAIEPATCQTSGPGRESTLTLAAGGTTTIPLTLRVHDDAATRRTNPTDRSSA